MALRLAKFQCQAIWLFFPWLLGISAPTTTDIHSQHMSLSISDPTLLLPVCALSQLQTLQALLPTTWIILLCAVNNIAYNNWEIKILAQPKANWIEDLKKKIQWILFRLHYSFSYTIQLNRKLCLFFLTYQMVPSHLYSMAL